MMDLDRKAGPWSYRVWGLIVNFVGNALAIYGAIGFLRNGSRAVCLVTGLLLTIACLLVLAVPQK